MCPMEASCPPPLCVLGAGLELWVLDKASEIVPNLPCCHRHPSDSGHYHALSSVALAALPPGHRVSCPGYWLLVPATEIVTLGFLPPSSS